MKQVTVVIKLRLNPDELTRACLDDQSRACNWLYNKVLEKANALKEHFKTTGDPEESAKELYSSRGLRNLVPGIKKDNPCTPRGYYSNIVEFPRN
jgi:putative transposase